MRFYITPNSLIHSFGFMTGYPCFAALFTYPYADIFKKEQFLFYKTVNGDFSVAELSSADGAQKVFQVLFSLLVFGSSHLAGSNQWTVII